MLKYITVIAALLFSVSCVSTGDRYDQKHSNSVVLQHILLLNF
jgi:hypothetical protein